ncbi:MAG: glycosyltransferase family 4 protein [Chloroflexi bacterium]|nr:glycosyltransferase family 4 protein [Chloroflexota bacterium]
MQIDDQRPLKVCLLTDVFPPGSGGSGYSTYYLGTALAQLEHEVRVIRPLYGGESASRVVRYGALTVEELFVPRPPAWMRKLAVGKIWTERKARRLMSRRAYVLAVLGDADILHGQHALSAVAASVAGMRAQAKGAAVRSVATVRDYWPICPVSTRLFSDGHGGYRECRDCHHFGAYLRCSRASGLSTSIAAVPRWLNTLLASRALAATDAVIAVSDYVRHELARSGRVAARKIVSIPNLVDMQSVALALDGPWPLREIPPEEPFLLFAGKLDPNKGAQLLPEALERSNVRLPLLIAGVGPLEQELRSEAGRHGLNFRFCDWLDNDALLLLMHRARALLFPSAWQEPLSRVLLEGCAAGAAVVALKTGGTCDIISHMESGWLAGDMVDFARGISEVTGDLSLNARLRVGARLRAEQHFSAPVVSARVEALYRELLRRPVDR